jgi:hypothetical protein
MACGRFIDSDGNVFEIQRPTWESVLEAMLESDRQRRNALQRDLMAWDANQRSATFCVVT